MLKGSQAPMKVHIAKGPSWVNEIAWMTAAKECPILPVRVVRAQPAWTWGKLNLQTLQPPQHTQITPPFASCATKKALTHCVACRWPV